MSALAKNYNRKKISFRYGFLGKSDGPITIGLIYLTILSIVMWYVAFLLYKKGYKIKS